MSAAVPISPRPSTAPRQTGFGDLTNTPGSGTQQTGQMLSQDYNPAPAQPTEFRLFGLTITQLVLVAAVGFGLYYYRKEIYRFVGKKLGTL